MLFLVVAAAASFAYGCIVAASAVPEAPAAPDGGGDAGDAADATPDRPRDAPPEAAFAISCGDYCTSIMSRCTGEEAQYESRAQCLNMCAQLPSVGVVGETADSIPCRAFQADPRPASPHCAVAGAFGGEVCASRCFAFCELTVSRCNSAAGNVQPFETVGSCLAVCQCDAGPGCYDFDRDAAEYSPAARGRLNCLEYYLRKAYASPAVSADPDAAGSDRDNCPVLLLAEGGACSW